jgi:hypothetical protein
MRQQNIIFLCVLVILIAPATGCYYHEQAFRGTILDIDTKQPIEGAVVVVEYKKAALGIAPEAMSSIINIRETLTDQEGNFNIPSYTTMLRPLSWKIPTIFIIFKPGYASLEAGSSYFEAGEELKESQNGSWYWSTELKYRIHGAGIVELPKLRTREERKKAKPAPIGDDSDWAKQKNLINAIREEWRYIYNEDPKDLYRIIRGK